MLREGTLRGGARTGQQSPIRRIATVHRILRNADEIKNSPRPLTWQMNRMKREFVEATGLRWQYALSELSTWPPVALLQSNLR